MKSALCIMLVLSIAGFSYADIIHVPGDQSTIQAGIDAAKDGNPRPNPDNSNPDMGAYEHLLSTPSKEIPTTLEKFSGDNQSGNVGSTLPNPLIVHVLDQDSNPMEGVTVTFGPSEGASVNPTQAMTNENGQAQTVLTFGAQPGEYNVTATVEGLDPVVFTATAISSTSLSSFTLSLDKGLDMISLPLQPQAPFTARSFAEMLGSTMVISYDKEENSFISFVPKIFPGDGFPIKGGKGYIVNLLEPEEVVFTGTAWSNAPSKLLSTSPSKDNWAFLVCGTIHNDIGQSYGNFRVENLRTGVTAQGIIGQWEDEKYIATFVDLSRKGVVRLGDSLRIRIRNTVGEVVSESISTVTSVDIARSYIEINMRIRNIIPDKTALCQNYPNPFNPETWIPFRLAQETPVNISIYDTKGQLIRTIALGNRNAGIYTTKDRAAYWDGKDRLGEKVSSGVYYYTLQAGEFRATRRMAIVK